MGCVNTIDYCVGKGATFRPVLRWGVEPLISKAITDITRASPAVVTVPTHGLVNDWPVGIVSAVGMTEINASRFPPPISRRHPATYVDANTIKLLDVNSSDYTAYESGGFVVYDTPMDLSVVSTAVLKIYDNPEFTGTALMTLAIGSGVTLDNVAKTISIQAQLAGVSWDVGYYQFVVTDTLDVVTVLTAGTITIDLL